VQIAETFKLIKRNLDIAVSASSNRLFFYNLFIVIFSDGVSRPIFASLGPEGFRSRLGREGFRSRDFEYSREMI